MSYYYIHNEPLIYEESMFGMEAQLRGKQPYKLRETNDGIHTTIEKWIYTPKQTLYTKSIHTSRSLYVIEERSYVILPGGAPFSSNV